MKQFPKQRESKSKNIERTFQNADMQLSLTMLMECVKTVTTPKAEPRKLSIVNIVIEHYTPKVSARIATYLYTINAKGTPEKKVMTRKTFQTYLNNEITSLNLL